ncbi:MAG: hypothetical protein V1752_04285 [Candidatus Firestonebacteria bacterium]
MDKKKAEEKKVTVKGVLKEKKFLVVCIAVAVVIVVVLYLL